MAETSEDDSTLEEQDRKTINILARVVVECALNHLSEWKQVWVLIEKAHAERKKEFLLDALAVFNA